jgi:GNAT superfamily N-acetyltransferase
VQIVRAQPADAARLSEIAWAAKASWGYPPTWLERWRDQLTITPEFVRANETFAVCLSRQLVGFHALLRTADTMRLEHLWVLPSQMGRGWGRALFQHAAARAIALGVHSLTIEADPNAEPFYLHLGAVRTGVIASEIEGKRRELPVLEFKLAR